MFKTKKKFLLIFLSFILASQYSCHKDCPEDDLPIYSFDTIEEMYSVGAESKTADVIQTSDRGYLIVGTSYASSNSEGNIVAIKTDSNGVQEWSTLMGKVPSTGIGSLTGQTVKYDEEGVKGAEETDGSFTIAGNRTYVAYPNGANATGVPKHSKIVFYRLSPTGLIGAINGVELRENDEFTEKISDFKIDNYNGDNRYILTGFTTNISSNKPNDGNNGAYDYSDILTVFLDDSFNPIYSDSLSVYGLSGKDCGTSIQIAGSGYVIIGTVEKHISGTTYSSEFMAGSCRKSNPDFRLHAFYGDQDTEVEGGYSALTLGGREIIILGTVTGGTDGNVGKLVSFQIQAHFLNLAFNSVSNTHPSGFSFIQPPITKYYLSTNNTFKARSIARIPNDYYSSDYTYLISYTTSDNLGKNISLSLMSNSFELPHNSIQWPYYYNSRSIISTSQELAGPVIPFVGTNGNMKYAYTGTFNANTSSSQIGWVLFDEL